MAITLKPFRQYDEHDVINMFTYDVDATVTSGVQALAGTIVTTTSGGWKAGDDIHDLSATQPNAAVNGNSYGNTLSLRYNLLAEVTAFQGLTDDGIDVVQPLGMLLHDVRTLDENGEDLRYNPRKADEMQVVVPGQAVPIGAAHRRTRRCAAARRGGSSRSCTPGCRTRIAHHVGTKYC